MMFSAASPSKRARCWRGYSLVELLVIVSIVAGVMAAGGAYLLASRKGIDREQAVQTQAREMAQLGAALMAWSNQNGSTLTVEEGTDVKLGQLIVGGYLPADFASHAGGVAHSPLGQQYRAAVVRSAADNLVRGMVWSDGAPLSSLSQSVNASEEGMSSLCDAVAQSVQTNFASPAGVLAVGARNIQGVEKSFRWPVTPWIDASSLTVPSTVVLVGFPELSGRPTTSDPPPGPPSSSLADCIVVQPSINGSNQFVPATCPAGRHEEARWQYCKPYNPSNNGSMAEAFDGGTIIFGAETVRYNSVYAMPCWVPVQRTYPCPRTDHDDVAVYALGTPFFRETCATTTWVDCPGHLGDPVWKCEQTITNPLLVRFASEAKDLFCCK